MTTPYPALVAVRLLRVDAPKTIMAVPEDWPRWAVLLPHVIAAAEHVEPDDAATSTAVSWLLDRAGTYLHVHGRAQDSRDLAERSLAIAIAVYGPDDPVVGSRMINLAGILRDLGEFAAARSLVEQALAIAEGDEGRPQLTAAAVNNFATILWDLGDLASARRQAERALGMAEILYGPDHRTVAICLNVLALILQDLGELTTARQYAERALAITEAADGPDHPTLATRLNNLGLILGELGEFTAARSLIERAVAIDDATYGPDHPNVATDLSNLAMILCDLGEPATARPFAVRALAITEAAYGPDHPTTRRRRARFGELIDE